MNVRDALAEVDYLVAKLEFRYAAARQAFGVRPDLDVAEERIKDAGATVMELGQLLADLQNAGFHHRPSVIQHLRDRYASLHQMGAEVTWCRNFVAVRSHCEHDKHWVN